MAWLGNRSAPNQDATVCYCLFYVMVRNARGSTESEITQQGFLKKQKQMPHPFAEPRLTNQMRFSLDLQVHSLTRTTKVGDMLVSPVNLCDRCTDTRDRVRGK